MIAKRNFYTLLFAALSFTALCSLLLAAVPPLREWVLKQFHGSPKVLSTLEVDFFNNGRRVTFAKVLNPTGLFVEVYELNPDGDQIRIHQIQLPHNNDGFFHYGGEATNLVVTDVTGDGQAEILAPTYDDNQSPHLNVFAYSAEQKEFRRMTGGSMIDYDF